LAKPIVARVMNLTRDHWIDTTVGRLTETLHFVGLSSLVYVSFDVRRSSTAPMRANGIATTHLSASTDQDRSHKGPSHVRWVFLPLRLNAGRHAVETSLDGHATPTREIEVSGKAEMALEMTLDAIAAPLPIRAPAVQAAQPAPLPVIQPHVVEKVIIETPASAPSSVPQTQKSTSSQTVPGSSVGWQRTCGMVVIATAAVGGVDAYPGSKANDAGNRIANATTDQDYNATLPDFDAGKSLNQRGQIIAGVGADLFVGGIVLVATAPASGSEKSNAVSLAPWVTAESGGVVVRGAS
jgi:hypothetical protein